MSRIQRLEILEKRAEIAQIKEVLTVHQTSVLRLTLDESPDLNGLYDRLIDLEESMAGTELRLLERGDAYRKCT